MTSSDSSRTGNDCPRRTRRHASKTVSPSSPSSVFHFIPCRYKKTNAHYQKIIL
ncbi:hypothetical protein DVU_2089 [Nitratidesulfovibrio vulgaris str. Hildenborough]|uniref:Uncharacterized protein n=1 Tax=Nitratidesulfovibrio vulgaris (strain ATCC 29579 / DSM 644 / CCUG 34227 / NCIMB 8303 / VKM B-1760 / Hildenborough) TaxID=882 RepID=Q72AA8_NITV2|nr:hypothetical protein DVU_2089 [Nitratidesulfovibrio vulgaris str. Hildenborough]